jgi:hypothetical protein
MEWTEHIAETGVGQYTWGSEQIQCLVKKTYSREDSLSRVPGATKQLGEKRPNAGPSTAVASLPPLGMTGDRKCVRRG